MSRPARRLMLVGLPDSGKTTFVGALWYAVDPGGGDVGLRATVYAAERAYLNQLTAAWVGLEPVPRTPFGAEYQPLMHVADTETGEESDLAFPDLSGEHFERQWTERRCLDSYFNLVREAGGAIMFVHPNKVVEPLRIETRDALTAAIGPAPSEGQKDLTSEERPFDPKRAPTASQLVEILQMLDQQTSRGKPFPLAIVISAWDRVGVLGVSPNEWLRTRLPLLDQYLFANRARFPSQLFGVSAQGGDLNQDRGRLENILRPIERIQVVTEDSETHDITEPVRWLINYP